MNLDKILDEAIRLDASDVHLIPGNKPMLRIVRDLVPVEGSKIIKPEDMFEVYDYLVKGNVDKDDVFNKTRKLDMSYEYKVSINLSNVVDNNVYSNDQQLTKKSTLLYCDKKFEEAFFKLVSLTQGNEYIYDNNNLGRLDKLDIHIQIGDYNTNDVNSIGIDPQSKNKNDLNHPLNKFRQNLVILRIGILENSMAKLNFN